MEKIQAGVIERGTGQEGEIIFVFSVYDGEDFFNNTVVANSFEEMCQKVEELNYRVTKEDLLKTYKRLLRDQELERIKPRDTPFAYRYDNGVKIDYDD